MKHRSRKERWLDSKSKSVNNYLHHKSLCQSVSHCFKTRSEILQRIGISFENKHINSLTNRPREVPAVVRVRGFIPVTLKKSNLVARAPLLVRVNVLFSVSPMTAVPKSTQPVSKVNWGKGKKNNLQYYLQLSFAPPFSLSIISFFFVSLRDIRPYYGKFTLF